MNSHDVLFPPGATARDWAQDVMLAIILSITALGTVTFFGPQLTGAQIVLLTLLSLSLTAPLTLRRHSPLITLALCSGAALLQMAFLTVPTLSLAAIPVVSYSVARWVPGTPARWVLPIGTIGAFLGPLNWFNIAYPSGFTAYILYWGVCMGAVITPYAVGRRFRELAESREQQLRSADVRYQLLLAERDQQTRLAEASTRTMIARELHDIVAHSLSVMIVQAEGARAASVRHPELAQDALTTIADTGREALTEMRRIVGVLRSDTPSGDAAGFAPAPRLADLPDLVHKTSDRAMLVVQGDPAPMSPTVELTAFRVVQEALTNFLKHAGPDAHAQVTLLFGTTQLVADIVDDGAGISGADDGAGNGLRGMYERVTAMGGTLRAGPLDQGEGFRVTAVLPLCDASSNRTPALESRPSAAPTYPPPSGTPGLPPTPPQIHQAPAHLPRKPSTNATATHTGGPR